MRDPKKPILSVILPGSQTHIIHLVMLAGLLLSSISDTNASPTATSVLDNEVTSGEGEANSASASATITIRMTTVSLTEEEWS